MGFITLTTTFLVAVLSLIATLPWNIYLLYVSITRLRQSKVKVICCDGLVGSGKTHVVRLLAAGLRQQFHPIIGTYYLDKKNNRMYVEEPLHLLHKNNLLNLTFERPTEHEDIFQVLVSHMLHTHFNFVIEKALQEQVGLIIMERHIKTVYHTFASCISDKYPNCELHLLTAYQNACEDLLLKYGDKLHNSRLLHGCVYISWISHKDLVTNILSRGRIHEVNLLLDQEYPVNKILEHKHQQMLELLNVPIYHFKNKFCEGNEQSVHLGGVQLFLNKFG